ncbi:unnamed protein product, partial [marine sediment metagenome]
VNKIDVDVYYDAAWHDVFEGAFASNEWVEKDILAGASLISKARVRLYSDGTMPIHNPLYEFMFNTHEVTAQEGIYFDTHSLMPFTSQSPYIVEPKATFAVRVYNDDDLDHNMAVQLAGFLQAKV